MKPDALRMLARQLRIDPNAEAIEDAAAALEACAREREALEEPFGKNPGRWPDSSGSNARQSPHQQ